MSATRFFKAEGVSPIWGVGPGCDAGPVSVGWSPLASAGVLTAVVLRWITLSSCRAPEQPKEGSSERNGLHSPGTV
jgi:hypothetical protein